jgi:hypothetical protein
MVTSVDSFMVPRQLAYDRIRMAKHRIPPLPGGFCMGGHVHAQGVCASKLALSNWLDALPFPLLQKAIHELHVVAQMHAVNEPARAMLESEMFTCHVCGHMMAAAYMDSHIAVHTSEMDRAAIIEAYGDYEPPPSVVSAVREER